MLKLLGMPQKNTRNLAPFAVTFFIVFGIDQLIKYKIRSNGGFYICNPGISFGIQIPTFAFWLILAVFVFFALFKHKTLLQNFKQNKPYFVFLSLFLGGCLSNLLDRLLFGCVVDYIFPFWQKLPVFNLADMAIFFGISGLLFLYMQKYPPNSAQVVDKSS